MRKMLHAYVVCGIVLGGMSLARAQSANDPDYDSLTVLAETILQDGFRGSSFYRPENDNTNGMIAWGESVRLEGLLTLFEVTQEQKYLAQFKSLGDYLLTRRDDVLGRTDMLRGRIVKGWGNGKYAGGSTWHNYAVHNAMIATQFARFAKLTAKNSELSIDGLRYLNEAQAMVHEYDGDWKSASDYSFYYFTPGAHDTHDRLPWNQGLAIGRAQNEILRAETAHGLPVTSLFESRRLAMAQAFKGFLRLDSVADAYWWEYSEVVGLEDVSHAVLDVQFAYDLYKDGIVFTSEDMLRFANAYTKKFRTSTGELTKYVDGRTLGFDLMPASICMRYAMLAEFDRKVLDACVGDVLPLLNVENIQAAKLFSYYNAGLPELIKSAKGLSTKALNLTPESVPEPDVTDGSEQIRH